MGRDWSKLDQVADGQRYKKRSDRQLWVGIAIIVAIIAAAILLMR